jgi:uncharacterized repeat protein (TIGR01451 family)/fimbrial isopeptide formation D2 family protein
LGLSFLIVMLALQPASVVLAQGDADPGVTLTLPKTVYIGQDFTFTVAFDNASNQPGYGPYIDLVFPVNGVDGAAGTDAPDGVFFNNATFLGEPVIATELPFPNDGGGAGCVEHPYAVDNQGLPIEICGTAGDKLVVLQLPFGSFTGDQPPAVITVNASMSDWADVEQPLIITATPGFQFGNDPLDNATSDETIIGAPVSDAITPKLITIKKLYSGPEDETATGPDYPREYTIIVTIAPGQTVTDLDVRDLLPDNMQFLSVLSTSPAATCAPQPSISTPGGALFCNFASILGSAGDDAVVTFQYFIPQFDTGGNPVIDPSSGDDVLSLNDARAIGDWDPLDPRDSDGVDNAIADPSGPEHTLEDQSIAIQKDVKIVVDAAPVGPSPDDILEYTLDVQISDFFAFQSVIISDTISDGQHVLETYTPTMQINGNGYTLAAANMNDANVAIACNYTGGPGSECDTDNPAANDGTTHLEFFISNELITRGQNGQWVGGCIDPVNGTGDPNVTPDCTTYDDDATTGALTFRTQILQSFTDDFPSGDSSVDQGDILTNDVIVDGELLNVWNLQPNGQQEDDDSATSIKIVTGSLLKTIYAVNGEVCATQPCVDPFIAPGQTLTYRIIYTIPSPDMEDLVLSDYLPLPIFESGEISTTFDTTISAAPPPGGQAKFGPAETFFTLSGQGPTMTTDPVANRVRFTYDDYDNLDQGERVIDILFTVTATDKPFADRLYLTNQVRSEQGSTNGDDLIIDQIVFAQIAQPVLDMRKGVVAAYNADNSAHGSAVFSPAAALPSGITVNAPGVCSRINGLVQTNNLGAAFNSDLSKIDAFDRVTYAIVVENTGTSVTGAYDVVIQDQLPAGVTQGDVSNLCVEYGNGAQPTVTGGLADLFGAGLEIIDDATNPLPPPAILGALGPGQTSAGDPITDGGNIIIITYDVVFPVGVEPGEQLLNTAAIAQYAGFEGGEDHIAAGNGFSGQVEDTATVTIIAPEIDKTLTATNQDHTTDPNVAIGEIITYTVVVDIPEGVSENASLVDLLDPGLAFVGCTNITPSAGVATDVAGGFAGVCNNPSVANQGRSITFDLGAVTNNNTDNNVTDTITFVYQAVVLNSAGNDRGIRRNNRADWIWTNGSIRDRAANATIVEPTLTLDKSATPSQADAGDVITFTLTVQHAGVSNADAFDVILTDAIPTGLTYEAGSLVHIGGQAPTSAGEAGGQITVVWDALADNLSSTMRFRALVNGGATPGDIITNNADVEWTSLPGDVTTPQSPHNSLSSERTGDGADPGGAENDYRDNASADVNIDTPLLAKFIASTSESHTGSGGDGIVRVVVGEIVRYRLQTRVPETTSPTFAVQLRDAIPAGLRFLDDGSAKIAFVTDNPAGSMTSTTITDPDPGSAPYLDVDGNEATVASIVPDFPVPAGAISGGNGDGDDVIFDLGFLQNADNDPNQEFIVIEFNALVDNVTGNQAFDNQTGAALPTTLNNTYDALVNGSLAETSNAVPVRIAEPALSLSKIRLDNPGDAGDTVRYRMTYTNIASGDDAAAAFDLLLVDTLDANLVLNSHAVSAGGGDCGSTTQTLATIDSGQTVTATVSCLNPGASVTVDITATVVSVAPAGLTIGNSADLTYTSLPGLNGTTNNPTGSTTPGGSGAVTGERTGDDGDGALNDYVAAAAATDAILSTPTIEKLAPSPTQYVIGDLITYTIRVTLPEGETRNLRVIDSLPAGLGYASHTVITTQAASGGLLSADYNGPLNSSPACANCTIGNSGALTFEFGNSQTNGSGPANGTSNNQFLLRVVARVLNISANQRTSPPLTNAASLLYDDPTLGADTSVDGGSQSITIIEPVLTLDKSITGGPATPDAGDFITYTVTIAHDAVTSGATAYDVIISDGLPAGLTNPSIISVTAIDITPPSAEVIGNTLRVPSLADGAFDLPQGATITVIFRATVAAGVQPDEPVTNVGRVTWSSLDGDVPGERTHGDGLLDQGGVNDYEVQDDAVFTVDGIAIAKSLVSTSAAHTDTPEVAIGEIVTYSLAITLPEGATASLQVIDSLPGGLAYVGGSVTVDAPNYGVPSPTVTPAGDGAPGEAVTLNFGAISVPGDNNPANDDFIIHLRARVADVAGNVGYSPTPTELTNATTAQAGSGPVIPGNTVDVQVVEPRMTILKSVDPLRAAANDTVTFTLTVANTGLSSAFDVTVRDIAPAGVTYVPASLDCDDGGQVPDSCTESGGVISAAWTTTPFTVDGGSAIIRFQATLNPDVVLDQVIANVATVEQATTLPGADPGERDEPDVSSTANVTVIVPDIALTKSDGEDSALPGEVLVYDLIVSNVGERDATGVVITDTVPANTTFVAASSTAAWVNCIDGAPSGTVCTYVVGDLAGNGGETTVQFAVRVDDPLPASVSQIVNSAQATDDRTHGVHPDGAVDSAGDIDGVQIIGDFVWYDANKDGVQNPGLEPGLADITVQLLDSGAVVDSVVTDASGVYTFHVKAGKSYDVRIDPAEFQAGGDLHQWTGSPQNAGADDTMDSDADPNTHVISDVSTAVGVNDFDWDFGMIVDIGYEIEKFLSSPSVGPIRTGDAVFFTIRVRNTGDLPLTSVPLVDDYQPQYMTYVGASIEPDNNVNDGTIDWSDLTADSPHGIGHALAPNEVVEIVVEFTGRLDTTMLDPDSETINRVTAHNVFADDILPLADQEAADGIAIFNPTSVLIKNRSVQLESGVALLGWETVDESQIVAFNLYRFDDSGQRIQITTEPIEAKQSGQAIGATYVYTDQDIDDGFVYYYELELLFIDGGTSLLDMGAVEIGGEIFLPIVNNGR